MAWLIRIANGRLADRLASKAGVRASIPPPVVGPGPDGESARLRAALDLLPRDQQEVLALRFLAHLALHYQLRVFVLYPIQALRQFPLQYLNLGVSSKYLARGFFLLDLHQKFGFVLKLTS